MTRREIAWCRGRKWGDREEAGLCQNDNTKARWRDHPGENLQLTAWKIPTKIPLAVFRDEALFLA
jgi:hypothetical protein